MKFGNVNPQVSLSWTLDGLSSQLQAPTDLVPIKSSRH